MKSGNGAPSGTSPVRADKLCADAFSVSRARAAALICEGRVTYAGGVIDKPSRMLPPDTALSCGGAKPQYVGRGGVKLAHALDVFGVSPAGRVCADVGASTGGFTDCLLQNGAARVFAIDTGTGQLSEKLCEDARVVNMEKTNVNAVAPGDIAPGVSLVCVDVSFVSVTKVMDAAFRLVTAERGPRDAILLVKPQFEAGRARVGKRGVVRCARVHADVLNDVYESAAKLGFFAAGIARSPITGGGGNTEFLLYFDYNSAGLTRDAFGAHVRRVIK